MNLRVKNDLRRDFAKHLANLDDKKEGLFHSVKTWSGLKIILTDY
ncbi:hypothetical protein OCUAc20_02700 [Acinetobacter baumannii]|nr:hypothetical protein OCUAc20_02700 [Acinetobacter baumannii]